MIRNIAGLGEAAAVPGALPSDSHGDFFEETKILVFTKALANGDAFYDLSQYIDKTYDWTFLAVAGKSDQAFQVNFKDPGGRDIYSSPCSNQNAIGTGQFPIPWSHGMTYPAGGKLGITLINQFAGANNIELVLLGVARYPTNR
jgi:hypothetical protein